MLLATVVAGLRVWLSGVVGSLVGGVVLNPRCDQSEEVML